MGYFNRTMPYHRNIGRINGNLWVGIFMKTTSTAGIILGLPLDIRHIAFAANNLGLSLFVNSFSLSFPVLFWFLVSISLIGFLNFFCKYPLFSYSGIAITSSPLIQTKNNIGWFGAKFIARSNSTFFA